MAYILNDSIIRTVDKLSIGFLNFVHKLVTIKYIAHNMQPLLKKSNVPPDNL